MIEHKEDFHLGRKLEAKNKILYYLIIQICYHVQYLCNPNFQK